MEVATAPSCDRPSLAAFSSLSLPRSARLPILLTTSCPSIASSIRTPVSPKNLCCRASPAADPGVPVGETKKTHVEETADMESFILMSLSSLDGYDWEKVKDLRPIFSDYGLIRYHVIVEVKWLLKLSQIQEITEIPCFSSEAQSFLERIIHEFDINDALEVKKIEEVTNHEVKAVEYFLKQRCKSCPEVLEFFHFACTSEDINYLAHALALKEAFNTVIFPVMIELCQTMRDMAKENAHVPMLSRTRGQPASPTTLGKEMAIYAARLSELVKTFTEVRILGKFAGAVGNYNAHKVAYPNVNWPRVATEVLRSLGINFKPYVMQIEPDDYIAKLVNAVTQFNNAVIDFDWDILSYISLSYFKQIIKAGEIGSSTMPHKVNPIDFQNSVDHACLADAFLSTLSMKLPVLCMQPDLTDSTVLKNLGVGLGHSLLAYRSLLQRIKKLQVPKSEKDRKSDEPS